MTNHCYDQFVFLFSTSRVILIWSQILIFHHRLRVPSLEDFRNEICFWTLNDKKVIDVYVPGRGFYYETYSNGSRLILVYETRIIIFWLYYL